MSPIAKSKRHLYPRDWPEISRRIRERSRQRCEWCGKPNSTSVYVGKAGEWLLVERQSSDPWRNAKGVIVETEPEYTAPNGYRVVQVVLTVAHLDHDPGNCADDNLAALCQRCHLGHDREEHTRNAWATVRGRKAAGDLFERFT